MELENSGFIRRYIPYGYKQRNSIYQLIDNYTLFKDQIINVCEMKYSETDYVVDAEFDRSQRRKISDFQKKTNTKYALHSTLITTYGVVSNSYSGDIQSIITSDDLFS